MREGALETMQEVLGDVGDLGDCDMRFNEKIPNLTKKFQL